MKLYLLLHLLLLNSLSYSQTSEEMDSLSILHFTELNDYMTKEFNNEVMEDTFNQFLFSYISPVPVNKMNVISGDSFSRIFSGLYNRNFKKWQSILFVNPPVIDMKSLSHVNYYLHKYPGEMDQMYYYLQDSVYEYKVHESYNAILIKVIPKNINNVKVGDYYGRFNFKNFNTDSGTYKVNYKSIIKYTNISNLDEGYYLNGEWNDNIVVFENKDTKIAHILIFKLYTPRQSLEFIRVPNFFSVVFNNPYYIKEPPQYLISPNTNFNKNK